MATKSTSKLLKMIPPAIRGIIMDRPLLASENSDDYDDLLLFLVELYKPKALDWFDVKKLATLKWEAMRMSGIKPAILETAPAAEAARCKEVTLTNHYTALLADHPDKYDKKSIQQAIKDATVPVRIINGKSVVERLPVLEVMEKLELSNEGQQSLFLQRLADRDILNLRKTNDDVEEPVGLSHQGNKDKIADDELDRFDEEEAIDQDKPDEKAA
jgi:hypothetical protein